MVRRLAALSTTARMVMSAALLVGSSSIGSIGFAQPAAGEASSDSGKQKPAGEPEKSWTDYIEIEGDFRYRIEVIDVEGEDLRYRHRLRLRPVLRATVVDGLEAVIRLGSGQSDTPLSDNQTFTDAMSTKPLWLDLAYVSYRPPPIDGLQLLAGKFKNSFTRVGKSELVWDPDLNPEGLGLTYQPSFGMLEPFVKAAGWFIEERKEDDDSWLMGAQTGLKITIDEGLVYILAGGGYHDVLHTRGKPIFYDDEKSFGNSHVEVLDDEGEVDYLTYLEGYKLVEGFAEVGGKIGPFPWSAFGNVVVNRSVEAQNLGWLVGATFSKPKRFPDFYLRFIYLDVQRDAVIGAFTDSDFAGGGTNKRGHKVNGTFQLASKVKVSTTYYYNNTHIDGPDEDILDYHRAQLDLKVKY